MLLRIITVKQMFPAPSSHHSSQLLSLAFTGEFVLLSHVLKRWFGNFTLHKGGDKRRPLVVCDVITTVLPWEADLLREHHTRG